MNLYIEGYRTNNKKLVQTLTEASYWYCAKLLGIRMVNSPNLDVEIKLVKDMKAKTSAYGFCSVTGALSKPREFQIELDASIEYDIKQLLIWLAHEFVHLKQFFRIELYDLTDGTTQWKTKRYKLNNTTYLNSPWEKEAYRLENKLADEFLESYYE